MMKNKLDLHGVRHIEVDRLVENFILCNQDDAPLTIITGASNKMFEIVTEVVFRIGCDDVQYFREGYLKIYRV